MKTLLIILFIGIDVIHCFFSFKFTVGNNGNLLGNFNAVSKYNARNSRLYEGYDHGIKDSRLILGGNIDDAPGLVKEFETEESSLLSKDLWNRRLTIPEVINELGDVTSTADDSVVENILDDKEDDKSEDKINGGADELFATFKTPPPGLVQLDDIVTDEEYDRFISDNTEGINIGLANNKIKPSSSRRYSEDHSSTVCSEDSSSNLLFPKGNHINGDSDESSIVGLSGDNKHYNDNNPHNSGLTPDADLSHMDEEATMVSYQPGNNISSYGVSSEANPHREKIMSNKSIVSGKSVDQQIDDLNDEFDLIDDENFVYSVDFGSLRDYEVKVIRNLMEQMVRNSSLDYKSQLLSGLNKDHDTDENRKYVMEMAAKFEKMAKILLKLNSFVNRNPLDIDWIFIVENSIHQFLLSRTYHTSTIKWTDDTIMITIRESGLSENELDNLQHDLYLHIKTFSKDNVFYGLQNIGLLLSDSAS